MSQMMISVSETEDMTGNQECGTTPDNVDEIMPVPLVIICAPNAIGRFVKLQRIEEFLDLNEIDIYVKDVGKFKFVATINLAYNAEAYLADGVEKLQNMDKTSLIVTQSSIYHKPGLDRNIHCKGANVIDGAHEGSFETMFCPNNTDPQSWLQVDLHQDYLIHEVRS